MTSIWWIRRDLRLTDNPALHSALGQGQVIPVFILDPAFSTTHPGGVTSSTRDSTPCTRICNHADRILSFAQASRQTFCAG